MLQLVYCRLNLWWTCFFLLNVAANAQDLPLFRFNGRLINDLGEPMEGAMVQFWHTDDNGNYNHPQFNTGGVPLVSYFQYFGTATTAGDGTFDFKTYRPGIYAARPITHIHFKIWWEGDDILTSQFYFMDENRAQPPSLQLALLPQEDGTVITNKTIVVNMGLGGSEPITPSQTAGPFYPVVDFFGYDSDMTVVTPLEGPEDSNPATTISAIPTGPPQSLRESFEGTEAPNPTISAATSFGTTVWIFPSLIFCLPIANFFFAE